MAKLTPTASSSPATVASSSSSASVTLSHDDFEALLKLAQPDPTLPSASLAQVSKANHGQQPTSSSWLVDSDASDHMTGILKCFVNFVFFLSLNRSYWLIIIIQLLH